MLSKFLGFMIITLVLAIDLMPTVISLLIFWDETKKKWKNFIAAGLCLGIQLCSFILLHKVFFGYRNFLQTIRRVISFDLTYQDIDYFPISLLAGTLLALVSGFCLHWLPCISGKKHGRLPRRRIAVLYGLVSVVGISVVGSFYYSFSGIENIVINEVAGHNVSVRVDETRAVCDYVELYNKGSLACAVEELYLSDNASQLKKKEISGTVIPPHGYLVVKLDDNRLGIRSSGGDTLFLSNLWGRILDRVSVGEMEADFSYCRAEDTEDHWVVLSSTPGTSNREGIARLHTVPVLSHSSGFYREAFDLQITAEEGVTIYYTLDGSVPTEKSEIYTEPIRVYNRSAEPNVWRSQQKVVTDWENYTPDTTPVDKAFLVRAIAVDAEGAVSRPVTGSYFVGLEGYRDKTVVSLVVDPEDFWGENGVYVTGKKYDSWYQGDRTGEAPLGNFIYGGRTTERPAYFVYLAPEKTFEQDIGIRIAGSSSRNRAQKAFSLFAREQYSGSRVFSESIFENLQSERLAIRGGYANVICQMLVPDRSFGTQQVRRAAVFLNGEFWYHTNLLEKYDTRYFYQHYGVNPNNVVTVKEGELSEGKAGDELLLQELYDYLAENDLADREGYAGFAELVDLQSYMDYMCFNIYIDNMDFREDKNSFWWRSREVTTKPYEDGKWRFLVYDLDAVEWGDAHMWGLESQAEKNSFTLMPRYNADQPIDQQPIFAALKKNPAFAKQFVLTFMDMVNTNFRYDHVQKVLSDYGPVGPYYHGGNGGTQSTEYYEEFFRTRASYIVPYMAEEFSLKGTQETLHLGINDPDAGRIRLNTILPDLSQGDWSGNYYTDFPVTVAAIAEEGYVFKGWSGSVSSTEESLEVSLRTGGASLYAVFEKET